MDRARFAEILAESANPVIYNGDASVERLDDVPEGAAGVMVGRSFVRALGARADAGDLLRAYIARSRAELCGDVPVLGRMKELLTYWCAVPRWKRLWPVVKLCRTVDELLSLIE